RPRPPPQAAGDGRRGARRRQRRGPDAAGLGEADDPAQVAVGREAPAPRARRGPRQQEGRPLRRARRAAPRRRRCRAGRRRPRRRERLLEARARGDPAVTREIKVLIEIFGNGPDLLELLYEVGAVRRDAAELEEAEIEQALVARTLIRELDVNAP